jgi:RNA polymerase sigma-70 factor, ECF subfamily
MEMTFDRVYREYRTLLLTVAYRMIGSFSESEDIVQDVFLHLSETDICAIQHMKAYLLRSVTHRSLNVLKSSRRKREVYPGPWLPEPVAQSAGDGPEQQALLAEDMSYALLVLMERLTPDERAAFLLRDVFGLSYKEAAEAMEKTEANCRKFVSRAKAKLGSDRPSLPLDRERSTAWVRMFTRAAETGRFGDLLEFVREDAVLLTDGGGKVRAALNPIVSFARIAAFFDGIAAKGGMSGEWMAVDVGGEAGLALLQGGLLKKVLVPAWDDAGRIRELYMITNPDKLTRIWR